MSSVSYILDASNATDTDIAQLQQIVTNTKLATIQREFVLYSYTGTALIPVTAGIVFVTSKTMGVTSGEKAVACASGEWLVLTTLPNVLTDTSGIMATSATQLSHGNIAVPFRPSTFEQKLGFRRLGHIPYLIARKSFVTSNYKSFISPLDAINLANKTLSLVRIDKPAGTFPDSLLSSGYISRPYRSIIKQKLQMMAAAIQLRSQRRRAEQLRKQVLPVQWSEDIPVFIICRDRVEPLRQLVDWCAAEGLTNIILIDNASTYAPLLDYYRQTPYEVIRLGQNVGHTSPWSEGIVDLYAKGRPFIVSDPDVLPAEDSHGAVKLFCKLLNEHPERTKVGFGLKIDDIPDSYDLKELVITWEKPYWESSVQPDVFDAEIDTTFAVYRPNTPYTHGPGLRTGGKFVARHEPWYMDSNNPSPEMRYYREHANHAIGSWGVTLTDVSPTYVKHNQNSRDTKSPS